MADTAVVAPSQRSPQHDGKENLVHLLPQLPDRHVHVAILLHDLGDRHLEVLLGHVDASFPQREHTRLCAHRLFRREKKNERRQVFTQSRAELGGADTATETTTKTSTDRFDRKKQDGLSGMVRASVAAVVVSKAEREKAKYGSRMYGRPPQERPHHRASLPYVWLAQDLDETSWTFSRQCTAKRRKPGPLDGTEVCTAKKPKGKRWPQLLA